MMQSGTCFKLPAQLQESTKLKSTTDSALSRAENELQLHVATISSLEAQVQTLTQQLERTRQEQADLRSSHADELRALGQRAEAKETEVWLVLLLKLV